jgi:hypothetical protein
MARYDGVTQSAGAMPPMASWLAGRTLAMTGRPGWNSEDAAPGGAAGNGYQLFPINLPALSRYRDRYLVS